MDPEIKGQNKEMNVRIEEMHEENVDVVDKDDADIEEEANIEIGGGGVVGEGVLVETSRRKRISNIYGVELFRTGLAIQPKNPYFVTRTTKRKSDLNVPTDFLKNYGINYEQVTYLVDPNGGEWKLQYKKWSDGRISYRKGWSSFCKSNFVGKADTCICEFVEGNRGPYIKVSIVRANQGPN